MCELIQIRSQGLLLSFLCGLFILPVSAEDCATAAQWTEAAKQSASTEVRIAKLEQALQLCPSAAIAYRLGVARLQDANDPSGALLELNKAAEYLLNSGARDPALAAAIKGRLAQAYYQLNQLVEAESFIKAALELGVADQHPWLWQINAAILDHPEVRFKPAEVIGRVAMLTGKAVGSAPKVDLYIPFDYDRDTPNFEGERQARELAITLKQTEGFSQLLVIGHSDRQGDDRVGGKDYNQRLSERRAQGVIALLHRIDPGLGQRYSFKAKGKGSSKPASPGQTEDDYRRNRRVEVQFLK